MHQVPSSTFATVVSNPSRVADLAHEYDRWREVYEQASEAIEGLGQGADPADEKRLRTACAQGDRRMTEILHELIVTPARSLYEFGLKARVVERCQRGAPSETEDLLAGSIIAGLMAVNDLPKIRSSDFSPEDILPGFIEPPALPIAPTPPTSATVESPPIDCLAGELGRRFGDAVRAHDLLDGGSDDRERAQCLEAMDQIFTALKGAICFVEAKSPDGVLAQICAAAGTAAFLCAMTRDEDEALQAFRSINACLWSIRSFVEQHFHVDAKTIGSEYWMPEHQRVSNRVARQEERLRGEPQSFQQAAE